MPEVWIQKGSEKTVEGNLLILIPPLYENCPLSQISEWAAASPCKRKKDPAHLTALHFK